MKLYDCARLLLASSSGSDFSGPLFLVSMRCNPISVPCRGAVRFPSCSGALGDPGVQSRCCCKAPPSHQQAFTLRKAPGGAAVPILEVGMEQRRDGGATSRPLWSWG